MILTVVYTSLRVLFKYQNWKVNEKTDDNHNNGDHEVSKEKVVLTFQSGIRHSYKEEVWQTIQEKGMLE